MIRLPVRSWVGHKLGIRRPRHLWEVIADTFDVPRWMVRPR